MPICAVVINISDGVDYRKSVVNGLSELSGLNLGEPVRMRIPAVIDTPSTDEHQALCDKITAMPGVTALELVCVHYDVENDVTERNSLP